MIGENYQIVWGNMVFHFVRLIWTVIFVFVSCAAALSAEFHLFKNGTVEQLDVIEIRGDILQGDFLEFSALLYSRQKALVALSGQGGSTRDALKIGTEIHLRKFSTTVFEDEKCFSECALIWLSGTQRLMADQSKISFQQVSKSASWLERNDVDVGGYLTMLGIGADAIHYVNENENEGLRFLNFAKANSLDIEVYDSASLPTSPFQKFQASTPSFDCKKAATEDELAVCSNRKLSEADQEMAQLFGLKLRFDLPYAAKIAKNEQREWLASRRVCRSNIECLSNAYKMRIKSLTSDQIVGPLAQYGSVLPSFNCNEASSKDEITVCQNIELVEKDRELARLYSLILTNETPGATNVTKLQQRQWLALRHSCQSDRACLNSVYDVRLRDLSIVLETKNFSQIVKPSGSGSNSNDSVVESDP